MKATIALIIPYFGPLPSYFPYFLASAIKSRVLDVFFFTDALLDPNIGANIKVHRYTMSDFNQLATRMLRMKVAVSSPYKLCDFKPAYGAIFEEYIRGYEFWGFGDIDVIFGNLEAFIAPLLSDNDVISFRKGWISGSLCVLRNCARVNFAYTESSDWRKTFTTQKHHHFDELGGHLYSQVLKGTELDLLKGNVDSFTHVVSRLARKGALVCAFSDSVCENLDWNDTLMYEGGHLMRVNEQTEVMYLHYVVMKRRFFEVPHTAIVPQRFWIRKTGIYMNRPDLLLVVTKEVPRIIRGAVSGLQRFLCRAFTRKTQPIFWKRKARGVPLANPPIASRSQST
jgi:hypothetical protein